MPLAVWITAGAGIVAVVLGVLLTRWYQRSKSWVGITSISRDDRFMVKIPERLKELGGKSGFLPSIHEEEVPLRSLIDLKVKLTYVMKGIRIGLQKCEDFRNFLMTNVVDIGMRRKGLLSFLYDEILMAVMNQMNASGALPLPSQLPDTKELVPVAKAHDFTTADRQRSFFRIDFSGVQFNIWAGSAGVPVSDDAIERARLLGQILQYYIEPHLSNIVSKIYDRLQSELNMVIEVEGLIDSLMKSRELVVRVQVSNKGGSPVYIEPFGLLKIKSAGKKFEPIGLSIFDARSFEHGMDQEARMLDLVERMAEKQGVKGSRVRIEDRAFKEYVVVKPGDLVRVELISSEPVKDPAIIQLLEEGILSCQIMLREAGKKWRPWLQSEMITLGTRISEEKWDELIARANKIKK